MITNEWLTPAADEAAARYGLLVLAWQGLYAQASSRSDIGSARSFEKTQIQAHGLVSRAYATERDLMEGLFDEIATEARTGVFSLLGISASDELSDAVSEAVSAAYEHFSHELIVQMERDVAFLTASLRRHALQVRIAASAKRIPIQTAVMQAVIGSSREIEFAMHDRGGNRWPSRKYVRALTRHTLLNLYNDVVALSLADAGMETASVRHLDAKAEVHGLTVAMSPDSEHPSYGEIRAAVFHPNAEAILVPIGAL